MKNTFSNSIRFMFLASTLCSSLSLMADTLPFGDTDSVDFANKLWEALADTNLVGPTAIPNTLYVGIHPHGAVLEVKNGLLKVNGHEGQVFVKLSYSGVGVSVDSVAANRALYSSDITVMFKRKAGYDSANQDWFWAKYNSAGALDATPQGIKLAGRVAKGKQKGCIACHIDAPGDDYLFME